MLVELSFAHDIREQRHVVVIVRDCSYDDSLYFVYRSILMLVLVHLDFSWLVLMQLHDIHPHNKFI